MISRAANAGISGEVVLADAFYGRSYVFRDAVRVLGFDYAVAIDGDTRVWRLDARGHRHTDAITVKQLGLDAARGAFRRVTWRDGTKGKLGSRFLLRRVKVAHGDGTEPPAREALWLVIEWEDGHRQPTKYFVTTLRERMSKKQIVRIIKERWKPERVYQELKGELGFDHYEGRSFIGWHHHVSVALCCYAFVVAERVRAFPPRKEGRVEAVRTSSRPERHFADRFATARLAIARVLAHWLPRCPVCHRDCRCSPQAATPPPRPAGFRSAPRTRNVPH